MVDSDPLISSYEVYKKYKPMNRSDFYDKELDYELFTDAVRKIVNNYEEYTSWEWGRLNYEARSQQLYKILAG